jgi:nucleoside-diphosphate-sugar epimerase
LDLENTKTILVTGCAGFIGFHICSRYLKKGYFVVGIDNLLTGSIQNLNELSAYSNFKFIKMSVVEDWKNIIKLFKQELNNISLVFHFASPAAPDDYRKYSLETIGANSYGLQNAITFAEEYNCRVIFASTSEIYGDPQISPQKENYWGNVNPFGERSCYDEAKRFGEALIYSYNKKHNRKHGIVRIFNTYGTHMNINDGRVITNLLKQALNGTDLTIYGDGGQTRSFCYIDDLILGLEMYAQTQANYPVNIGNDQELSVLDLAQIIIEKTGSKSKIQFYPLPIDDPKTRRPDLTLAKKLLYPWKPQIDIYEGLDQMIHWMKNRNFN